MSILSSVKSYIIEYAGLKSGAPVWVDHLGQNPTQYSIVPLPGTRVVEHHLDGGSLREFPFAFQSMESTSDELERLENSGFFETFTDWLESQTESGDLPTLGAKKTAEKIEALGWAYLYEQGKSSTGIYQVQCKLTYDQEP